MKRIEEPLRWLDPRADAPPELKELLAEGRQALQPTPEQLSHVKAYVSTLGAGAAAGGAGAGAGGGLAARTLGHALAKVTSVTGVKVVAALAVGGAVAGGAWSVGTRSSPQGAPLANVASVSASSPSIPAGARAPSPEVPSVPDDLPSTPAIEPRGAPPAPPPRSSLSAPAPVVSRPVEPPSPNLPPSPVAEARPPTTDPVEPQPAPAPPPSELALLTRARGALPADPQSALAAIDEHRSRYVHGVFEQERELLAIEALLRLGRRSEAEARAAAFAAAFPRSVHLRRIEVLLGEQVK